MVTRSPASGGSVASGSRSGHISGQLRHRTLSVAVLPLPGPRGKSRGAIPLTQKVANGFPVVHHHYPVASGCLRIRPSKSLEGTEGGPWHLGSLPMCPSPWNGAEAVQSPSRRSDFQLSPTLGGRATPSTVGASNNQWPESFPSSRAVRRAVTSTEVLLPAVTSPAFRG